MRDFFGESPAIEPQFIELSGEGLRAATSSHDERELQSNLESNTDLMGINNRNLKTFELTVETSRRLSKLIPDSMVKVSESGIESPEVIVDLKRRGFRGFLIGQTFMQNSCPEKAAMDFIQSVKDLESKSAMNAK